MTQIFLIPGTLTPILTTRDHRTEDPVSPRQLRIIGTQADNLASISKSTLERCNFRHNILLTSSPSPSYTFVFFF